MTEYSLGGAGESGEDPDALEQDAKILKLPDQEFNRKRMFLGKMVTQEYLEELGLSRAGDDESQAHLADALNAYVVSGMMLEASQKTDAASIDSTIELFQRQLPDEARNAIGMLVPLFLARGIEFQAHEHDSEKVQRWLAEYDLLHDATSE